MTSDISKNTIIVLVILTVVISLIGTWVVIDEVNSVQTPGAEGDSNKGSGTGQIKLTIDQPPNPIEVSATGQVVLSKTQ